MMKIAYIQAPDHKKPLFFLDQPEKNASDSLLSPVLHDFDGKVQA